MDVLWQKLKEQSSSIRSAARVAESAWLRVPAMCCIYRPRSTAKVTPWLRWLIRMPAQEVRPARLSVRTVASRFIVKNLNKLWQRKK